MSGLAEIIECPICLEIFDEDCKVLPCQHTFCTKCLTEVKNKQGSNFSCPECCVIYNGSVEELPGNILVKRILSTLHNKTQECTTSLNLLSQRPPVDKQTASNLRNGSNSSSDDEAEPVKKQRKRIITIEDSNNSNSSDSEPLPPQNKKKTSKVAVIIDDVSSDTENAEALAVDLADTDVAQIVDEAGRDTDPVVPQEVTDSGSDTDPVVPVTDSGSDTEPLEFNSSDYEQLQATPDNPIPKPKGSRSSTRIQEKQSRCFTLPGKRAIFDSITDDDSRESYTDLKDRKPVNDFTKVTNRYNYDPNVTSGSDSLDSFIDDDYEYIDDDGLVSEDSNYEPQENKQTPKTHRKRRYARKSQESCESEESEEETQTRPKHKHSNSIFIDSDSSEDLELSRSILNKVEQRSKTMSEKKKNKARKFDVIRAKRAEKSARRNSML